MASSAGTGSWRARMVKEDYCCGPIDESIREVLEALAEGAT
jgi:hypothetical protein